MMRFGKCKAHNQSSCARAGEHCFSYDGIVIATAATTNAAIKTPATNLNATNVGQSFNSRQGDACMYVCALFLHSWKRVAYILMLSHPSRPYATCLTLTFTMCLKLLVYMYQNWLVVVFVASVALHQVMVPHTCNITQHFIQVLWRVSM